MNPLTSEEELFQIFPHEQIEERCDCPRCRAARESGEGDIFENNGNPISESWRNWGRGGDDRLEVEAIEDFERSHEESSELDHLDLAPITGAGGPRVNPRSTKLAQTGEIASSSRAAELEGDNPLASKLDALRNWTSLLLLKVGEKIRASLASRKMRVQYAHNESYSNDLNIDLYPVRIDKFPTYRGDIMTPAALIKHIRMNLNSLVDTSISSFQLHSSSLDGPSWASDNPIGAVLKIRIRPDNAAVVVSSATPTGWTFTTIDTPETGTHPVSGHRTFFIANRAGIHFFINKGLDMTSTGVAGLGLPVFGEYGYGRADKLWISLQNKLVEFINNNGGAAKKEKRYSNRIEWRFVFYRYRAALEKVFGKGAGSAEKSRFFDIVN